MKIDWAALGIVSVVSIAATVLFMALLAGGIRLVAAEPAAGQTAVSTSTRVAGFVLLGLAGLLVLLGIYLILPISG
jgi:hypothetical protein